MKSITIIQPWATLIALGEKKYETRGWPTKHRGPLAIHAGKKIDKEACEEPEIKLGMVTRQTHFQLERWLLFPSWQPAKRSTLTIQEMQFSLTDLLSLCSGLDKGVRNLLSDIMRVAVMRGSWRTLSTYRSRSQPRGSKDYGIGKWYSHE
jgi:hypothetical protein